MAEKEEFIQEAIKRPGDFTRKAEKRGLTPAQFQEMVLANPKKFDKRTVRQARLRKTLVSEKVAGKK